MRHSRPAKARQVLLELRQSASQWLSLVHGLEPSRHTLAAAPLLLEAGCGPPLAFSSGDPPNVWET